MSEAQESVASPLLPSSLGGGSLRQSRDESVHPTTAMIRVRASTVFHFCCIGLVTAVGVPYVLAVENGHVHIFLPMISDCQVHAPEVYFSRVFMVAFGGCGTALLSAIQAWDLRAKITRRSARWVDEVLNAVCLALALVCAASTAGVGVVSKVADRHLHNFFALLDRWDTSGRLAFFLWADLDPNRLCGAFCLVKNATRDRFVLGARPPT